MDTPDNPENTGTILSQPACKAVLLALTDGLIVTDRHFTIQFANAAFAAVSGKNEADMVAKKCHQVFAGRMCHTPACPLQRALTQSGPIVYESDNHCKISPSPWQVTATAYHHADGRPGGMVEKITDGGALSQIRDQLALSQERLRKNMGAIIQAMSMTIEKRDPYTAGHQLRVAKLCRAIATELDFSWEQIQGLRMAAAIHDLGKIHVPSAILNKPGPMSEHEMAIIRMHPRTAYDILKGIQFPWPLAQTIHQHHERLDGSGYPRKLKGDEILLQARILAVADVVESMASHRPYRAELDLNAAMEELRANRGILYDPQVVDVCIRLIIEKGFDFKSKQWRQAKSRR